MAIATILNQKLKLTMQLYNTLTRKKENFTPISPPNVGFYSCGPTVYNFAHIGNLRSYIFADTLKRALESNNFKVKHVMNITDVGHLTSDADSGEDKMEKGAKRENKTPAEIANFYTQEFKKNLQDLNIIEPNIWCKATDYISEMIEMIKKIQKNNLTYETDQAIYFNVKKYKNYTRLSGQKLEDKLEGARDEVNTDPQKKHPADFALWFKLVGHFSNHILHWSSPWGEGFPGWHIECSAMSIKYLGEEFDIHSGGIDHIPVHHSNERAQNWGACEKQESVKFWVHNEFLNIASGESPADSGMKMAKSGKNFLTLKTLIDKNIDPLAFRYLCLQTHYRQQIQFSWEALESAKNALKKLRKFYCHSGGNPQGRPIESQTSDHKNYEQQFSDAIDDDLNTPQALAIVWEVTKNLNLEKRQELLKKFDEILGLDLDKQKIIKIPDEIKKLAQEREQARKKKDFTKADELRAKIEKAGFVIEDTNDGFEIVYG